MPAINVDYLAGRNNNPPSDFQGSSSSATLTPVTTWVGPFMMLAAFYAMSQGEAWPVSQSLGVLRGSRPDRRERGAAQYMSRLLSGSAKLAKLVGWTVPKGERTRVIRTGDARQVVATFRDGSEYTFTVVKRSKDDPKGYSAYVIDDVRGGEFDTAN